VRYASVVKGINNGLKKTQGLVDGFNRKDIAAIKDEQDAEFRSWFSKNNPDKDFLKELDTVIASDMALTEEEFAWSVANNSELLRSARTLYRLALETAKPDAEREAGFQQRDVTFIAARLNRLEQSYMQNVDQARYTAALQRYNKLDAKTHPQGLDILLPMPETVASLYQQSELSNTAKRLAWLKKDLTAFQQSDCAFIKLAIKWHVIGMSLEERRKEVNGNLERVIPQYMRAVIAWKNSQGKPVYADANSTLRVTYGTVAPYSPQDGVSKGPFTTVEGIVEKHTGKDPFIAPENLLTAIKEKRYGVFKDTQLGTVPVDFLSSADTTGGNSGSAVLNKNGELVGLNFDSTYESITKDWYFDSAITRAIHVDIRYMLWVMKEVDHADNVLKELTVRYPVK